MFLRSLSRLPAGLGLERYVRCRLAGKTLMELLVVIAIIATVMGLWLPAAMQVLKAVNNLK
jgi:Tfp pilus assembly protein FimT